METGVLYIVKKVNEVLNYYGKNKEIRKFLSFSHLFTPPLPPQTHTWLGVRPETEEHTKEQKYRDRQNGHKGYSLNVVFYKPEEKKVLVR